MVITMNYKELITASAYMRQNLTNLEAKFDKPITTGGDFRTLLSEIGR